MKVQVLSVFIALAGLPASAAAQQHAHPQNTAAPSAQEEAVRAVVLAHAAAVEQLDLATLDSLWSPDPDVMIIEGAGADVGWENYREHHLKPEFAEFEDVRYRYENVAVNVADHVAWATFDYTLQGRFRERDVDVAGKGTMILRHTPDGGWKIVHSHTSGRSRAN